MKEKLKSKKFWVSLIAEITLILQLLGVRIDAPYVNELVEAICAVLLLIGLLDVSKTGDESEKHESQSESDEEQSQ